MSNRNYVILGASAAGINAIKTLKNLDKESNITLISKDSKIYSRCMLHHVISGHRSVESINFIEDNFIEENNINWLKNKTVNTIDTENKIVKIDNEDISYDKLLIATGASAFIPPIKNIKEGNHIYPLRNIEDVFDIKEKIKTSKKVAIIGAGLIGIDALTALMEIKDLEVSLIYPNDFILDRQLDEYSAKVYEDKFTELGAKLYPSLPVNQILLDENNDVKGVELGDNTVVECDMIIVSTGVKPNTDFIDNTDIENNRGIVINDKCETNIELGDNTVVECDMIIVSTGVKPNTDFIDNTDIENNRGIVINDKCETNIKDVYAAGDVVGKNAIWPLAVKQGVVAAYNMAGLDKILDDDFTFKNSMNFVGIPTVSLGIVIPPDESYDVITRCDKDGYRKIIIKDNIITGFLAQGDISYTGPMTYLIRHKIEIKNLKDRVFEIGYADFFSMKENGEFEYDLKN